MSRGSHVPRRQCVGCARTDAQAQLARFALRDGRLEWDRGRRTPGRGAYLHLDASCLERFASRKPFLRSLRASVGAEARRRLIECANLSLAS